MTNYLVALDTFHGPLDLLLYLVKRNEVDVLDIPIAKLADQFLDYLAGGPRGRRRAGRRLPGHGRHAHGDQEPVAAAGRAGSRATDDEPDPRRELVKQLLEYRKFKDAAAALEERAERQRRPAAAGAPEEPAAAGGASRCGRSSCGTWSAPSPG